MIEQGRIVLAPWPWIDKKTNQPTSKIRPLLIICDQAYQIETNNLLGMKITSSAPRDKYDLPIHNWKVIGLQSESTIRAGQVYTFELADVKVVESLGSVEPELLDKALNILWNITSYNKVSLSK